MQPVELHAGQKITTVASSRNGASKAAPGINHHGAGVKDRGAVD